MNKKSEYYLRKNKEVFVQPVFIEEEKYGWKSWDEKKRGKEGS